MNSTNPNPPRTGTPADPIRTNRGPERDRRSFHPRTSVPHRSKTGSSGGHNRSRMRGGGAPRGERRDAHGTRSQRAHPSDIIPPLGDNIRIITLGGVEEIGRNMTAIEYKNDIIVIDAGFMFKEEETPGIDYILPNTKYLEERKDRIRALIITHGHLDHIGGLPYIIDRIGNPPIYTRNLTAIMIQKRQVEFPHLAPLDMRIVEKTDRIKVGELSIRFFAVTHTIPDSMGIIIETPYGSIVTPGDFKLNHMDGVPVEEEEREYEVFKNEKTLLMLADSTNVENPGFSTPESIVHKNLEEIIRTIKGRLIIGTFASQLARMIKIVEICEQLGKKVSVEGRGMKVNIEIAEAAEMLKVKKGTLIPSQDIDSYPPDKVVILCTGAQGEEFAALMRIATGTHKFIRLSKRDTVLLSSSIIPGNEKSVQRLKDNLARQGAHIVHYRTSDVFIHSTGHGNKGELEWLHKKIRPKFFIPIHGHHYHLKLHAELAESLGMTEDRIVIPDTGSIIEISEQGQKIQSLKEKAPSGLMPVDGFAVGDIQEVVLRDRQMLAQDGVFVIFAVVNISTGKLRKSPDIISRGFVYLRESQELLRHARFIIKKNVEDLATNMNPINFDFIKDVVTDELSKFLFQQTAKRPIVIPVLVGV